MRALRVAVQIAKRFDGKITLIHVYSEIRPIATPEATMIIPRLIEAAREAGAGIRTDGEEKVKAEGVQVETLLRKGHTVEEILKTARENELV